MIPKKALIIGLDGFTWRIGKRLIHEGHMPTLCKLLKNGCHGTLESVVPCETSPAWSSFQTGCYPEKTGIFAFHGYSSESRQIKLNSFQEIKVPTIWELLSAAGKKVISINMPITSPPPQVNGIIVPGLTCPEISKASVFPSTLYDKYIKHLPDYRIVFNSKQPDLKSYVDSAIETEQIRCKLALMLMQKEDWDLFSLQIQSTDAFQHKNWYALDPTVEGFAEADYNQAVEFYKSIDQIIAKLIETAGDSALTVIASDHGFCAKKKEIGINTWLSQNGYLSFYPTKAKHPAVITKENLKKKYPVLKFLAGIYGQSIKLLKKIRRNKTFELYSEKVVRHIRETIDFDHTTVFCLGGMGGSLYITDNPGNYDIQNIIERLMTEYGPNSPEPLIASITPLESDPESKAGSVRPNYMIHFMEGVEARINPEDKCVVKTGILNGRQCGTHDKHGIWVFSGTEVRPGEFDANIVDIIPTILSYLEVPVPKHVDGKILSEAFKEPLKVQFNTAHYNTQKVRNSSDDDQSIVEKQLKDLGYL